MRSATPIQGPPGRIGAARRVAVAAGIAVALGAAAVVGGGEDARAGSQAQPNIVVITTDDQSLSMMRGRYMPQTTKQIAERGATFTDYIVTTPLCCPSRATLL
ncbi:MAG TPA: sulfatase-like hydrolase/transferase, partial [Solirubrobacterales bacterium]|nr:sulfatase-like hydrolase/transferase [Solirubrobacterales bacterium]